MTPERIQEAVIESEFGKGLTYCIGLFLCHSERDYAHRYKPEEAQERVEMWFYGASDHLYEMQIPDTLPEDLRARLTEFQDKCMAWRLPMGGEHVPTKEDKTWAIKEAKELLRLVDAAHGVETAEASWT